MITEYQKEIFQILYNSSLTEAEKASKVQYILASMGAAAGMDSAVFNDCLEFTAKESE